MLATVPADDVPFYSRTEVLIGSAIMLALCLIVLVAVGGCVVATTMTVCGVAAGGQHI